MGKVGQLRTPTIRRYEALAAAAELVAAYPAKTRQKQAHNAMVPWDAITQLRRVLDDAGIDWRTRQYDLRKGSE